MDQKTTQEPENQEPKKMKFKINKDLLPMKAHYFLFNGGVSPVQPFMPVIARELNFSSNAVGIIYAILPFTGMLAKPLFGAIADRFRLHKFIFILFQAITIIGFFSIQFIPKIEEDGTGQVKLVCGPETNFDVCFKEPNKYTSCLIQDVIKESFYNKTVTCSLRCNLTPELRTELCGPWKVDPSICTEEISSKPGTGVYTQVKKDNGPQLTDAEKYFSSSISSSDDVKLEFIATVPMYHILNLSNCLYFRVTDAQLNDETHHIPYCKRETDTMCKIHCEDSKLNQLLTQNNNSEPESSFVNFYQFWTFLFLAIISWIGMAVVGSVADAVCFEMLGEKGDKYGKQRLWGSVGWGTFVIISGLLVDKFSSDGKTNYAPAFYIMLIVVLCDIMCSYTLKYEQTKISTNIFKNVGMLLKDVWIDIFLLWCVVLGMCVGVQWTFLFWHLENLSSGCTPDGNMKTILGLVSGVQCFLGELPSFFIFGWLIKKISHTNLMTLIPFVVGVRFILYSVIPNPWWALPIEILQGSLGLAFATMASYASIVAPPGTEATIQGLVGAIFEGIGVSIGNYLGGIIFKEYGGKGLFLIFGSIAIGLGILHGALQYMVGRNAKLQAPGKESTDDEGMTSDSSMETIN